MNRHVDSLRRAGTRKRIVFPEGSDPRIREAACRLAREGLVAPILIGPPWDGAGSGVAFVDPAASPHLRRYAGIYYERRRARGVTELEAAALARQPMYFAKLMVAAGDADGSVGGVATSTGDAVRAALHCIGTPAGIRTVSSVFFLAVQNRDFGHQGVLALADCAIVIEPTAVQLADIAIATAASVRALLGTEPVVALALLFDQGQRQAPLGEQGGRDAAHSASARAGTAGGWRASGGRRPDARRVRFQSAGLGGPRQGQHPDFPRPRQRQHCLQDGGAAGRRGRHWPLPARAGQGRQRPFPRLLGRRTSSTSRWSPPFRPARHSRGPGTPAFLAQLTALRRSG